MARKVTLIERVACAIAEARGEPEDWLVHLPEARAAVAAMREPTQNMLDAAGEGLMDLSYINEDWQVMVDAALEEETSQQKHT